MTTLGVEEGLSAGLITGIMQDHKGYMWFGTSDGLNRYDGHRFKKYGHAANDPYSLTENYIRALFKDSRGWLWTITSSGKLHIYNELKDNFFKMPEEIVCSHIKEDQNGNVWVQTPQDEIIIIKFYESLTYEDSFKLQNSDFTIVKPQNPLNLFPKHFKAAEFNNLLFTSKTGAWHHTNDTLYNFTFNSHFKEIKISHKKALKARSEVSLKKTQKTNIIVASNKEYIWIYDVENKKLIDSTPYPNNISNNHMNYVKAVDFKNRIWIKNNVGLFRRDIGTKKWMQIKLPSSPAKNLKLRDINNFYMDNNHNFWLGTNGYGIFKCTYEHDAFKYYGSENTGPSIYKIGDYNNEEILINYFTNTSTFKRINYIDGTVKDISVKNKSIEPGFFRRFRTPFIDSNKKVWFSIDENPIRINENNELEYLAKLPIDKGNYRGLDFFKNGKEEIWVIANRRKSNTNDLLPNIYLLKWLKTKKKFTAISTYTALLKDYSFGNFMSHLISSNGSIWLGFDGGGLLKYNPNADTWKHFYPEGESNEFFFDQVLSIQKSIQKDDTNFWVGTRKGLIDYNYKENSYKIYGESNGLPNTTIYGVLNEDENHIWFSSNSGLSRFNHKEGRITNYAINDGLQHTEFNRWSYLKKKDGTMFFGGVGGLSWFHPKDLKPININAKVVINGLLVDSKRRDSLLFDNRDLSFKHNTRLITFEFSKLNLTAPDRNNYTYKLEKNGNKEDWVDIGNEPKMTFTNLSAGDYEFSVGAYDFGGVLLPQNKSVAFSITKPWWNKTWFRILYSLIIGLLIYYLWFVRIRSKLRLEKLRTSLSRDLHDEIGSTLSSIALFGTIAEKEVDSNSEQAKKLIRKINSDATESIVAMNDIVWTLKSGNDTIENLVKRIRFYTNEIEDLSKWTISINCEEKLKKQKLNKQKIRDVYLIIKEALNNAFKYSQGDEITLHVYSVDKEKFIVIEIKDNGIGMSSENLLGANEGNGLGNMQYRAERINGMLKITTDVGKGTKIKLVFKI